jgi:hypothetical protein
MENCRKNSPKDISLGLIHYFLFYRWFTKLENGLGFGKRLGWSPNPDISAKIAASTI